MNLTYELAKELKDAGFPQNTEKSYCFTREGIKLNRTPSKKQRAQMDLVGVDVFAAPTLSELIEECGDAFYSLSRYSNNHWVAIANGSVWMDTTSENPEVAVARLWLVLQKKS